MNYEQKYKESLERAEEIIRYYKEHNRGDETSIEDLEQIFPELKESEDERIRRELKRAISVALDYSYFDRETADNCIAWLENQCKKTQQTPRWMINFLHENRVKFASLMDGYDEQREVEGKLLAIIDWLEKQGKKGGEE